MAREKLWTKDFVLGAGVNFAIMANYYSLMVVVADYAMKQYGSSAAVAGLAASIFIIGALVSRVVVGYIMDRVGRKRLLLIVSTLEVLFSAAYFLGLNIGVLFVLRFCHGFCYGAGSTTVGTVVTSIVPNSRKGEGIGYYMLSVTVGAAIGPFLGMFLTQVAGYELLFGAATFIAVGNLVSVILLKVPEQKLQVKKAKAAKVEAKQSAEAAVGEAAPATASTSPAAAAAAVAAPAAAATSKGASAAKPAASKHRFSLKDFLEFTIFPLSATCAVLYFCYSSLLTFLTPFSAEAGLETASSFFFVVYAIATFATRPFTGKLFDSKGDKYVMIPAFVAFIIGMAILSSVHTPVAMLVSAALLGFGVGTIQSSALALCVRMTPDSRIALANSTFYMFLDLGVGVGPLLLGMAEPVLGYRGLFISMAFVATLALVAYLFVGRKRGTMRRLLKEDEG
jgi:MFS family permease